MTIIATRFGPVRIEPDDLIHFPDGLIGLPDCRKWVLLADCLHDAVAWLQSAERPALALPVVSPRRYVPDYRLRVTRQQIESLMGNRSESLHVLVVVTTGDGSIALNLRAPLVINLDRRLGRQVVANGSVPVAYRLAPAGQRKQIA